MTLFIVGSGFTHGATCGGAPLNSGLMKALQSESSAVWKKLRSKYKTQDVETALTRLDLESTVPAQTSDALALRRKAEQCLAAYFSQFRFNNQVLLRSPWLEEFASAVFAADDVVVSLNYDCLLEGLLDQCLLWSPDDGYGRPGAVRSLPVGSGPSPVVVLKIHGSENFHRSIVHGSKSGKSIKFTISESLFPVSGKGKNFCLPVRASEPAVIAPSFVKVFPSPILCLMNEALDAAQQASTLVIMGCGMRPEDAFLYVLLWRFLSEGKRVIIVDPEAGAIGRRISQTLEYDIGAFLQTIDKPIQEGWPAVTAALAATRAAPATPK